VFAEIVLDSDLEVGGPIFSDKLFFYEQKSGNGSMDPSDLLKSF